MSVLNLLSFTNNSFFVFDQLRRKRNLPENTRKDEIDWITGNSRNDEMYFY